MKCDRVPFGFGKKETKTMTLKICRLQNRTGQARPGPVWLGSGFHQVGKRFFYHGVFPRSSIQNMKSVPRSIFISNVQPPHFVDIFTMLFRTINGTTKWNWKNHHKWNPKNHKWNQQMSNLFKNQTLCPQSPVQSPRGFFFFFLGGKIL